MTRRQAACHGKRQDQPLCIPTPAAYFKKADVLSHVSPSPIPSDSDSDLHLDLEELDPSSASYQPMEILGTRRLGVISTTGIGGSKKTTLRHGSGSSHSWGVVDASIND